MLQRAHATGAPIVGINDELDDEKALAIYCPECVAREFGTPPAQLELPEAAVSAYLAALALALCVRLRGALDDRVVVANESLPCIPAPDLHV